jgi:hypothetical protein
MRLFFDLSKMSNHEIRRAMAAMKAFADYPPEGLEISSGPITINSRAELKKRAEEALAVAEGAEVVHTDLPEAPEYDPAEAEAAAQATTTPDVVEEAAEEAAEAVREAAKAEPAKPDPTADVKQKAKSLMLQVTKSGVSVPDLKAKLAEAVPDVDPSKYDEAQYATAIEVMKGMLPNA